MRVAEGDDGTSSQGSTSTTSEELELFFLGLETYLSIASQSCDSRYGPSADIGDNDVTADNGDDPLAKSKEENVPKSKFLKRKRQETKAEEPITTHK